MIFNNYIPQMNTTGIVKQLKQSEKAINRKLEETKREIRELQPCDYEIKLKKLNNEIMRLKTINSDLQDVIKGQENLVKECIEYVKNIEGIKVKKEIRESFDSKTVSKIKIEYITIPEFKIGRMIRYYDC